MAADLDAQIYNLRHVAALPRLVRAVRRAAGRSARHAEHMHAATFPTVVGDVAFGKDGEWAKSRMVFSQFQNVTGNDIAQFRDTSKQVIIWPEEYKSGAIIYPYPEARKK